MPRCCNLSSRMVRTYQICGFRGCYQHINLGYKSQLCSLRLPFSVQTAKATEHTLHRQTQGWDMQLTCCVNTPVWTGPLGHRTQQACPELGKEGLPSPPLNTTADTARGQQKRPRRARHPSQDFPRGREQAAESLRADPGLPFQQQRRLPLLRCLSQC